MAVPKKDSCIQLCGDYKVTLNPEYPLPQPKELNATLSGGKLFTNLDFYHLYNQFPLHLDSRKLVTVNTHRGLYQYTHPPFGVASSLAIFQKTMDCILQGLEGVMCYLNDLLITGSTIREHIQNLKMVPNRLLQHYGCVAS